MLADGEKATSPLPAKLLPSPHKHDKKRGRAANAQPQVSVQIHPVPGSVLLRNLQRKCLHSKWLQDSLFKIT